ncbi:MAG: hypothetical protein LKF15_02820 [Lachnospiraceae bacterium]|jgi:hypothetical protein|nr:hypothetical protein [Lachnospiraceae bacterium]MCH4027887.1 hypothetical protein [Lachnospiraceae bacterium]MCH4065730.1 hypothetical protein [Lachnospiraceae bacterium]MCH4111767.1 hypothetical protein [Lachnospiraceae bacterium]
MPERISERHSLNDTYIQRIFQISGLLKIDHNKYGTAKYNASLIYNWLRGKFQSLRLPDKMRTVSRDRAGQSVDVIYDYQKQYFCMLAQHPDQEVPGRMWSIEAEIIVQDENVRMGAKLSYSTPVGSQASTPNFSIPRFVRDIAYKNGIFDGWRLERQATYIQSSDDLQRMIELLTMRDRLCPVIVIAECEENAQNPFKSGYLVDPDKLANSVYLTAHVIALPVKFQDEFRNEVGENLKVYDGAVRTYYPNLSLEDDDYKRHPFSAPSAILAASYSDDDGTDHIMGEAYQFMLADRIQQYNSMARIKWSELGHKFYYQANRELLKERISSAGDIDKLKEEIANQEKQYETEIKSAEDAAYSAMEDTEKYKDQLAEARDTIHRLNTRLETLQYQLEKSQGQGAIEIPIPDTYEELPKWVDTYFPGRMVLNSRAYRSLKDAEFEDVHLVYQSLKLLGDEYCRMRAGTLTRNQFDEKCQELGVTESGCIADSRAGELGDIYFIPDYHGRRVKIDRHIKNGSAATRDPKRCMRIYFFWDDDMQQVVICYLPQHQQIRTS